MENVAPSPSSVAIKWALIGFLVSVVLTYAFQFMNVDPNSPVKYINYVFFIAFLLLGQKEYKDKLGGYLTFGQGFLEGFLFSLFWGIMVAIFTYIYFTMLSPGMWDQAMDVAQKNMEAKGTLSSEQIESAMSITRKYGIWIAVIGLIIGTPIIGAIISLIGAAIFKKERSPLDFAQDNNYTEPVN